MTNDEILIQVSSILKETFDDDTIVVTNETSADDIEEWDSLSHIELISNLEGKFKVRFALGELQDLKNIGDMVGLISSKI